MDNEYDYLFGVLAVQANVISAAQLSEALLARSAKDPTSLGDWLVEQRWIQPADRIAVGLLVDLQLKKNRGDVQASSADSAGERVRQVLAVLDEKEPEGGAEPTHWLDDSLEDDVEGHGEFRGRYALVALHARGGIGRVWRALDENLGREVALKELQPEQLENADRFLDEARVTGQLEHPGIVPVYELVQGAGDRPPFYTMRFVKGRTMSETIRVYHENHAAGQAKPMDQVALLQAFLQVANTVAYAHDRGVIHRDLKGQNVVLGEYGEVVVLDWGLAKVLDKPEAQPGEQPIAMDPRGSWEGTLPGQRFGTPGYMAPEQAIGRSDRLDQRTDVYGLGALLYEILTTQPPFTGSDSTEILRRVREEEPKRPRELCPTVPKSLEAVCLKALAKRPEDRYASAAELGKEVQRFLADEPVEAYVEPWSQRLARWTRRHRTGAQAAAVTLAATTLVAIAAAFVVNDALERETVERRKAEHLSLSLTVDRALSLCEAQDIGPGMLWLARALEMATRLQDKELSSVIRANLAAWQSQFSLLQGCVSHRSEVRGVAFSPDGRLFLTGSSDGTAQLWNTATGTPVGSPALHDAEVYAVAFSPDGKLFLTGSRDNTARLWDTDKRQLLDTFPHPDKVWSVAFSPDGKSILTGCDDYKARLWELTTHDCTEFPHQAHVRAAVFSPDGNRVLTGCSSDRNGRNGRTAQLWDRKNSTKPLAVLRHESEVMAVAFSPDGKMIATAGKAPRREWDESEDEGRTIRIWDAANFKQLRAFAHQGWVYALAFSPDGKTLLTGSEDMSAQLWDIYGRRVGPPLRHQGLVYAVAFSPNGQLMATGSFDSSARVWKVVQGEPTARLLQSPNRVISHLSEVLAVALDGKGQVAATGSEDGMVRLWDVPSGNPIRSWQAYPDAVTAVAFSHDGNTLATGNWEKKTRRGTAQLWKTATGEQQLVIEGRDVMTVALSQDGRYLLTGGSDKTPRLWDISSGKQIRLFQGHTKAITAVAFSPDGQTIATASEDHTARIWRLHSDQSVSQPIPLLHEKTVSAIAFSPDGKMIVTGSHDKSARLWHTDTGRPYGQRLVHVDKVNSVAFSPDGKSVLTGVSQMWVRPGEVRFWDVATNKALGPPLSLSGTVGAIAFDGRVVLTGSGKDARFWNPPTSPAELGESVVQIVCWSRVVTGLDLDPDGVIRVLDADSWKRYYQNMEQSGVVKRDRRSPPL